MSRRRPSSKPKNPPPRRIGCQPPPPSFPFPLPQVGPILGAHALAAIGKDNDRTMLRIFNPFVHTKFLPATPYGTPGCVEPFEKWNETFEQLLHDAYLPEVPMWVTNDSELATYVEFAKEGDTAFRRHEVVDNASRLTQGVRVDKCLSRWQALKQKEKRALLMKRFEADALEAAKDRHPNHRLQAPELVLSKLLHDNGQGFVDLVESLCYLPYSGREMREAEQFPILPNPEWERLIGASDNLNSSRYRRAYIEVNLLRRHFGLTEFVNLVFDELAVPGDSIARRAEVEKPHAQRAEASALSKCPKTGPYVFYCNREHQVEDWPKHKARCGRVTSTNLPSPSTARHPTFAKIHDVLTSNPTGWWVFKMGGREACATLPPSDDFLSPSEKAKALAEFRRIAFAACDYGSVDEVSTGVIGLLLKAWISYSASADTESELKILAKACKLGDGAVGRRALEGRMQTAREVVYDGAPPEYRWTRRILDYLLPAGLDASPPDPRLTVVVRIRHLLCIQPRSYWRMLVSGNPEGFVVPVLPGSSPSKQQQAIAQSRKLAFRVLEAPDAVSTGLMANVVHVHLHMYHGAGKVDIDAEIETLLLLAGLPAGKPGRKILKKRAPDALFSEEAQREFPIVVEFLNRSITAVLMAGYGLFEYDEDDFEDDDEEEDDALAQGVATLDLVD